MNEAPRGREVRITTKAPPVTAIGHPGVENGDGDTAASGSSDGADVLPGPRRVDASADGTGLEEVPLVVSPASRPGVPRIVGETRARAGGGDHVVGIRVGDRGIAAQLSQRLRNAPPRSELELPLPRLAAVVDENLARDIGP